MGFASCSIQVGDLLVGDMVGQGFIPLRDSFEETDRVIVIYNVCRAELENVFVFFVFSFGGLSINFRVLHNVGFAVLENNETDGFGSVALAYYLGCEVNVLRGGEADECRVSDLDEGVVDTVGVDMIDVSGF